MVTVLLDGSYGQDHERARFVCQRIQCRLGQSR